MAENGAILVINSGSSSIKFAVFQRQPEQLSLYAQGQIAGLGQQARFYVQDSDGRSQDEALDAEQADHSQALMLLLQWLQQQPVELTAAGHRVVHGGDQFQAPVEIDHTVLQQLRQLEPLAPLHQPHNLRAIEILQQQCPGLRQVACFDTAFHQCMPPLASCYALPQFYREQGIKAYGFHGLSYEYVSRKLKEVLPSSEDGKVIVAHLGNGASLCALHHQRSIATTMGFTPLDGLVMGTRCGRLDPGVLIYLMRHYEMQADQLEQLLNQESGLLGLSGISSDMQVLQQHDEDAARFAIDRFCYQVVREIGSMTAALQGLDALVFTGGIGEHAAAVRQQICEQLGWLGIELDRSANERHQQQIQAADSRVPVLVIPVDEQEMIARHCAHRLWSD